MLATMLMGADAASLVKTYATFDPSNKGSTVTLSGGNLVAVSTSAWQSVKATQGKTSGKWVFEMKATTADTYAMLGIADAGFPVQDTHIYVTPKSAGVYVGSGIVGSGINTYGAIASAAETYYMFAVDLDARKCWVKVNGAWQRGNPVSDTSLYSFDWVAGQTIYPTASVYPRGAGACYVTANFGASAFVNDVPSGFNAGWYTEA